MILIPKGLVDMLYEAAVKDMTPDEVAEHVAGSQVWGQTMNLLEYGKVDTSAGPVYRIPLLEDSVCDLIVERAKGYNFTPNLEEEAPYRIDEAVLIDIDPQMHALCMEILQGIGVWAAVCYQRGVKGISSIQVARYSVGRTDNTGWHHDEDSDLSVVVSLNPGDFEGGGTAVRARADRSEVIPPLPKGHAIMFPGKLVQHRGLPVTKGERYLLVFWLKL